MALNDSDWRILLERVRDGRCTPFIGAGVHHGVLPLGSEIAAKWAKDHAYPLEDRHDLARVSQFVAITTGDKMYPKEGILRLLGSVQAPDFASDDNVLGLLAELPLPVYITTNYDDFVSLALRSRQKEPRRELCRWNSQLAKVPSAFDSPSVFQPTVANPIVFHLHGHQGIAESVVLTEDDYLDFLVSISKDENLLPPRIQAALTGASLLFLGYRLADWDFRVIFRGLVTRMEASLRRISIAVQLRPEGSEKEKEDAQRYLNEYFQDINVRVYWGTVEEFAGELRKRWRSLGP